MPGRRFPLIYEINTWTWLTELSLKADHRLTLAEIPDSTLDELAAWGFDAIWLMGVWARSQHGRMIARSIPGLLIEYAHALPDYTSEDIVGSPYAIHQYVVDPVLGGRESLAALRSRLADRGLRLILDYVPNHVAVDHPWTRDQVDVLITGTPELLEAQPGSYYLAEGGAIVAHGRDPYFPPWTDTAQVDAFAPSARAIAIETLSDIAAQCDGVRCDMAMLLLNRIFSQTWHRSTLKMPDTEFWMDVISAIRQQSPDFLFIAEAYWDTEAELHMLGFNAAYDKRLYDRLRNKDAGEVRDHLLAGSTYQGRMVRFIENHDEARAMTAFGSERSRAAAVMAIFSLGFRLIHDGQMNGAHIKLPVQLGRRPIEPIDTDVQAFYKILVREASHPIYHDGTYMALAFNPMYGNNAERNALLAFAWSFEGEWRIGVVNLSNSPASARLMLPIPALRGQWCGLWDVFTNENTGADGDELLTAGLPVALKPFGFSLLELILA